MSKLKILVAGAMLALSAVVARGEEGIQQRYDRLTEPLRSRKIAYEITWDTGKKIKTLIRSGENFEWLEFDTRNKDFLREVSRDGLMQRCEKDHDETDWDCEEVNPPCEKDGKIDWKCMREFGVYTDQREYNLYAPSEKYAMRNNPTTYYGRFTMDGVECEMFDSTYNSYLGSNPTKICIHDSGAPVYSEPDNSRRETPFQLRIVNFTLHPSMAVTDFVEIKKSR